MPFREKSAWVTLVSILLVLVLYLTNVPVALDTDPGRRSFHVLLLSILAFIVIEVAGLLVLRLRNPEDARTARDERERLIDLKATQLAARCFVVLVFLAVLTVHHGATARAMGYYIVFAFALSQLVNYGARIYHYRRGA